MAEGGGRSVFKLESLRLPSYKHELKKKTEKKNPINSPILLHNGVVATVAGAAGLRQEHVEVVRGVIAAVEALAADGHARRYAASATPVGDDARYRH